MDYTVVTAWYDIRTKEDNILKDSTTYDYFYTTDSYFEQATIFFGKPFPMVIFTEPRFQSRILAARPVELHEKTRFIFKDYDEVAMFSYFPKFEANHDKNPVINLDLHKFTPLYKFIVNQKTNFMKDVVEMNPFQTSSFAWMDLRLHIHYNMSIEETTEVINDIHPDRVKIMFMCDLPLWHINGRHDFYSWTRGKVAAGFFAGKREPILQFARLCKEELIAAINEEMAPSDEMIYSFVTAYNLDLFDPYVGEYCDCLRNQKKVRNSLNLALPFFYASVKRQNTFYIARLADQLRFGQLANDIRMVPHDTQYVWFHGCIAHFRLGGDYLTYLEEYRGMSLLQERPELSIEALENVISG